MSVYRWSCRALVAANRSKIRNMLQDRIKGVEEKSDSTDDLYFENIEQNQSKMQLLLSKALLRARKKIRSVIYTGCYCVNTVGEWFNYTFCCIIIKKKKTPGVLRSARI